MRDMGPVLAEIEQLKFDRNKFHELYLKYMAESVKRRLEVESQKDEIQLNNVMLHELQSMLDAQKAITELAIEGLKWYADKKNWNLGVYISMGSASPLHEPVKYDKGKFAIKTLSEIERLQHELLP